MPTGASDEIKILINAMFAGKKVLDEAKASVEALNRAQYESLRNRNALLRSSETEAFKNSQANIKQQILLQKELADQQQKFNDIQRTFLGRLSTIGAKGGMEGAIKQNEEFGKSFAALAQDALIATGILTAFAVAIKSAYDFGKEGAAIDRLRETGTKLAQSYGVDMEEAVAKMKTASHGAISANEAITQANRSMLLGVARDTDTMAKLLEIAAIRGRAAGLDTEAAFERIILGIGRLSTRVLDDIGIVIDGETAYANYGKSIGEVADDLTEAEKRQALTNAIIEDGNQLLHHTGGLVDDAANVYERFETHITDATNSIKTQISDAVSPLIKSLDILLFGYIDINAAIKTHARDMASASGTYAEYESELRRVAESQGLVIDSSGNLIKITRGKTGAVKELIQSNYLLSESEYNGIKVTDDRREAIESLNEQLAFQEQRENAITEALEKLNDISGKTLDFGFEEAAKKAIEFNEKAGTLTPEALDKLRVAFGLADEAIFKFRDALEVAGKDGIITLKELQDAFKPVAFEQAAQKTLELWEKVDKKIQELRDKYKQDVLDSERELADDMIDAATKRDRDLADLEEKSQKDRDKAISDAEEKRHKDSEDAESAYQRRIQKILDKYARSRIQALIDLDARALFEAELARNEELKDAEADRKQKEEDAERQKQDRLKDIADEYDNRRREIQRQYDREVEDARRADERRKRDLQQALQEQIGEQEAYRRQEEANIELFLTNVSGRESLEYQQRITNLIRYWQERMGINQYYGDLESGGGGTPSGNPPPIPYGEEPGPPAPIPDLGDNPYPAPGPGGGQEPMLMAGGTGSNIMVTLNVQGDGILASAVRNAALNAVVDVIAI